MNRNLTFFVILAFSILLAGTSKLIAGTTQTSGIILQLNQNSQPVTGATVSAVDTSNPRGRAQPLQMTSPGTYRSGALPLGTYNLTISLSGQTLHQQVNLGTQFANVAVTVPAITQSSITINLANSQGNPPRLNIAPTITATQTGVTNGVVCNFTGGDGKYVSGNIPGGTYSIYIGAAGYSQLHKNVTLNSAPLTVAITLTEESFQAKGHVIDANKNVGLAGVLINVTVSRDQALGGALYPIVPVKSDANGNFYIKKLPSDGTMTITASINGYKTQQLTEVSIANSDIPNPEDAGWSGAPRVGSAPIAIKLVPN